MELSPVALGIAVPLTADVPVTLGRLNYNVHDTRISRQHVTARLSHLGATQSITIAALKPVYVEHSGGDTAQLSQGQTCQLHIGDIVYLLKTGSGYEAGFRLQCRANPVQLAPDPESIATHSNITAADEPPSKRHKAAAASVSSAVNETSAAAATLGNGNAGPFRAAIAAAAQASGDQQVAMLTSRSASAEAEMQNIPSDQQTGPLFAGVRLVDWDGHHTQMAVKKAAEEGADVSLWLDDATTHVIARYELAADEVQRRLAAQAQKQQRQQRHSVAPKKPSPKSHHRQQQQQQQQQLPADKLGPGSPGDLHESQLGSQHGQQQQRQQDDAQQPGGQLAVCKLLPPGLQFVTVSWITNSLKSRCRLPEAQFHTDLQQRLQRSRSGAHTRLPSPAATVFPGAVDKPTSTPTQAETAAAAANGGGGHNTPESGTHLDRPNQATIQDSRQQQQQHSPGSAQRRLQRQQVVVPVPAEVCPADTVWGTGGRWIEAWDDAAALESSEHLMAHWYQTTAKHSRAAAAAAAAMGAPRSTHSSAGSRGDPASRGPGGPEGPSLPFSNHQQQQPSQQRQQEPEQEGQHIPAGGAVHSGGGGGGGGGGVVAPCDHVACSQQSFCLVEEMERLKRNYHGRSDQFRIKAASRAIQELERLQQPIIGPQDIEAMPIGEKSKQKLQEILQTGRLRRNDVLESSELHKTIQLFMTVWGCADSTARKWWAEGCRSLDDVRHKASGLTAIQQMGLRYYDDFECRIPRAEVAEAVSIIRDTTLDVLEGITGKPREELSHLLHVRALGSYVRGKQDTGDIDMLLAAGPAAEEVPPGTLAAALLHQLQDKGYVPEGLSFDHRGASLETAVRVSWMGVWKGPTSPCYRRLDIKTYERPALPYAVNYFSSGQDGSRALRYWCTKPRPEVAALAAAVHPAANAFHLSDTGLYVVYNAQLPPASSNAVQRQDMAAAPLLADAMAQQDTRGNRPDGPTSAKGGSYQQGGAVASTAIHRVHALAGSDGLGAATAAGIPVVTADSHSPTGPVGRVECSCETEIFRAVGLAYIPPHLRG